MRKFPALARRVWAFLALSCFFSGHLTAQLDAARSQSQNTSSIQDASPAQSKPAEQAQTPANAETQAPGMTIRETVRRVIVDVMVRDSHGKPVHGLTSGDFSITEDKQPQRVLSFDVYDFDKPSISRAANAPALPPNVFVNVPSVPERGPLYVMLCDLVNTEVEDQMTARQQILKFISSKPAGTRFAIFVTSDKLYLVQGFTEDKDLLYAALDPKSPKPHVPKFFLMGRNYGRGDPFTALDMLTHIGQYLDGIPGRKNLIWVAGSFDVNIFPRDGDPVDMQADIKGEINALAQAQVAVFPVDVRGVIVNPAGALTGATPNGGAANLSASTGGPASSNALNSPTDNMVLQAMRFEGQGGSLNADYATEEAIASMTGGRAFFSTNDLTDALNAATEDGGNYYTLTYSPSAPMDDGKCHNISVKLDTGNYQLSYRRNYCRVPLVSTAAAESAENSGLSALAVPMQAGDVLQDNMRQGAPMVHDLVFSAYLRTEGGAVLATPAQMEQLQAQAAFFRTHRRNRPVKPLPAVKIQSYTIDYRVLDPQFKAQVGHSGKQPTLEFAMAAFDDDGKVLNGTVNDGVPEPSSQPSDNKAGLFRLHQALIVPLNARSIRVGVRDRLTDRIGTLEVPLPLAREQVGQGMAPVH